ncbi:hypothetical protein [Halonatronum saccharophilum]|uniref:hypothetical protein n=1 Tax=Halonatronum saccharophilum TaxID=150060 RepID=UPI0012EC9CE6|nr:hypothetical protein [Halonatronum saccharophilum]
MEKVRVNTETNKERLLYKAEYNEKGQKIYKYDMNRQYKPPFIIGYYTVSYQYDDQGRLSKEKIIVEEEEESKKETPRYETPLGNMFDNALDNKGVINLIYSYENNNEIVKSYNQEKDMTYVWEYQFYDNGEVKERLEYVLDDDKEEGFIDKVVGLFKSNDKDYRGFWGRPALSYKYDKEGRVNRNIGPHMMEEYKYNNKGQRIETRAYIVGIFSGNYEYWYTEYHTYNQGKLIKTKREKYDKIVETKEYFYDDKGNRIKQITNGVCQVSCRI